MRIQRDRSDARESVARWTGHLTRGVAPLVLGVFILVCAGTSFGANSCHHTELSAPNLAQSDSWCWAASLEYLYKSYNGYGFSQPLIANRICTFYCPIATGSPLPAFGPWDADISCGECYWCNKSPYDACDDHDYTGNQVALFMYDEGFLFTHVGVADPNNYSMSQLSDELCASGGTGYFLALIQVGYGCGHMMVVTGITINYDSGIPSEFLSYIHIFDPDNSPGYGGHFAINFLYFRAYGNQDLGPWKQYIGVNYYSGNLVSVNDIQSFQVSQNTTNPHSVDLEFTVQQVQGARAAVYVSDNPLGPAQLVDTLTAYPSVLPASNTWVDSFRLPPAGYYYYWLDYDVGGFAQQRSPRQAGLHRVEWDGRNGNGQPVASGVYFYKLVAGSFTDTKKMTILK